MKAFAACITLVLIAGCASTTPKEVANAPNYILLSSPNQVRDIDFASSLEPRGFNVRGVMTTAGFRPTGQIQGNGDFCTAGNEWLGLSDLKVHSGSEPKRAPYIVGCLAKNGTFQPASRDVVTGEAAASAGAAAH